ncbi:hypothetical protein JCM10207_009205 [Rhodosporidiobolus poonsookiae]
MTSPPPQDASLAVYTRNQLLALYPSPLVPSRLEGMKELAEWYGEYTAPPSPPTQRHGLPSRPSHNGTDRGERSTPSRRPLQTDASNPFTNFGRFGVDGGLALEGDGLSGGRRRGERGERSHDKDLAPHLGGIGRGMGLRGDRDRDRDRERDRDRGERNGEGRRGGERDDERRGPRNGGLGELERRKESDLGALSKKDMRRGIGPADEGGWRNVGLSREEREKRLTRNQASGSSTVDSREPRRDRDRDAFSPSDSRSGGGSRLGGGGRPAWMDDEGGNTSSSSPAWMDAPASGNLSFGNGRDLIDEERKKDKEAKKADAEGASAWGAKSGGMDSIQAWKAQMKEMEQRERDKDLQAAGLPAPTREAASTAEARGSDAADAAQEKAQASVFSALSGGASGSAEEKSIFADLGIVRPPPGLVPPRPTEEPSEARAGGGGRGSRFARFFDGKPPTTQAQSPSMAAAEPPSVFGALMSGAGTSGGAVSAAGGAAGLPGPSKEDTESMARLLGMLQVQGARATSPTTAMKSPPQPQQPVTPRVLSPPVSNMHSPIASPAVSTDGGRSTSRFNFSKSTSAAPSQPPQHAPQPHSPPMANPSQPPPPPGFGFPLGPASPAIDPRSPPVQARPPPQLNGDGAHPVNPSSPPISQPKAGPSGPFSPPLLPPGMPPQFFSGPPGGGPPRFPPSQLPGMPPFAMGPDGRPIVPPPGSFAPNGPPPFPSPNMLRNGPLSPPLSPPNGLPFPPPHLMFGPGGPQGGPGPNGAPPPPPPGYGPPSHLAGRMPPPVGMGGPPPPPPPFGGLGGNPGADLMALLNSGASGARIGPMQGQQQQQPGVPARQA